MALISMSACLDQSSAPSTSGGLSLRILASPGTIAALDSGHVIVDGPTRKTVTVTPGTTVTIDGLAPGSYTVGLQGFRGGGVAYFGQTTGVNVVAGQNTPATITFASFQPVILSIPAYTTDGQFVMVFSKVQSAASYVVQKDPDASFGTPQETAIAATDTSVQLSIPLTGPHYVRVLAVDPYGVRGQASAAQSITTLTTVTVSPATGNIAAGATQQFSAVAKDAQNNTITGITFYWASSNQNVALVDQTGLASGVSTGTATITALGLGVPGNAALTVTGPAVCTTPSKLVFSVQPTDATTGAAISPAVAVAVQDASDRACTTAQNTVTLAIGTNPGGGTLSGTKTVNAVNGVASFSGLSIDKAGTGYTLVASSGALTGATSAAFNILAAAVCTTPSKVVFTVQPTSATAGAAISPAVEVEVRDASDRLCTTARNTLTLAIGTNPGSGSLSGTVTVNAVNGVASFSGLSIDKAGAGYTLAASATSLTGATSSAFNISPGPAARLQFAAQPPISIEGNSPFTVQVQITDAFANVVTAATNAVTVEFDRRATFGAFARLIGTVTTSAVAGVAQFANLRIDVPGSGYALRARSGALTPAGTNDFNVILTFTQVDAGDFHTCGVTVNNSAYCWGANYNGQLGIGSFTSDSVPRLVAGGLALTQVSAGAAHTCGVTTSNAIYCWGYNGYGQLGINSTGSDRAEPTQVQPAAPLVFAQVAAGGYHTCATTTSSGSPSGAYCWGRDFEGELGDGTAGTGDSVPKLVPGGFNWKQISGGFLHTCAIHSNDTAYCWGYNVYGQVGINSNVSPQPTPQQVSASLAFARVSTGYYHSCAGQPAAGTNKIWCWGRNSEGQIGNGAALPGAAVLDEVEIASQLTWVSLGVGGLHTCMIDGTSAYCVGYANYGQLGNGTTSPNISTREQVLGSHPFTVVAPGTYHTCALNAGNGQVWCWGYGGDGELGNGARPFQQTQPVQVIQ